MYTMEFYTAEDSIFELRAKESSNITRVFYYFSIDKKAIRTNRFMKKSQKPPKRELALAKNIRRITKGDTSMSEYSEFKQELLKNPRIKAEYDALAPEYDIIQAMSDARQE